MLLVLCAFPAVASALQALPPVKWGNDENGAAGGFSIADASRTVYINSDFASRRDEGGLTMIPPSASEFAETFLDDLKQISCDDTWKLETVDSFPDGEKAILLGEFRGSADDVKYEDGGSSEEGYELEVGAPSVSDRGCYPEV